MNALTHQYLVRFNDLLLCSSTDCMSLSPLNVLDSSLQDHSCKMTRLVDVGLEKRPQGQ